MGPIVNFKLPWPPTVNQYWRHVKGRVHVSNEGNKYRRLVAQLVMVTKPHRFGDARLQVKINAWPPDAKARDLDNLLKAPLDALERAGVYDSDSQIDALAIYRMEKIKDGALTIRITEFRRSRQL